MPATSNPIGRRTFLTMAGAAAAGVTLSALPLGFAGPAAALTGSRSLVCVFLAGGADSFNMFVPRDHSVAGQTHAVYAATRGRFAVPAGSLLPIFDGQFGLNPGLGGMAAIANAGQLAVVQNVGPLAQPISKTDFLAGRSVPQSLFAHDAQQKLWETARPTLTSTTGWAGSLAEIVAPGAEVAPSFSLNGSNRWQASVGSRYSRLSASVPISLLNGYSSSVRSWVPSFASVQDTLASNLALGGSSSNVFEQAAANSIAQSITTTGQLQEATADNAANDVGMDDVGGNPLGMQLREVARLIKNRDALNMPRQIFFVRVGGWDTHQDQDGRFPALLADLDGAVASFQAAMNNLGVADSVTTFTASDFGRTLTNNGDGTDHGWGGNAFVMGGAVTAGRYGTFPNLTASANNPDDISDGRNNFAGRLIPTTSVSQHGATLARWMGLNDAQSTQAFPELSNFTQRNLGYLG
ncbi:MAG: DUF1501 domain-containing protein [Acidimicrobiales bacterium]